MPDLVLDVECTTQRAPSLDGTCTCSPIAWQSSAFADPESHAAHPSQDKTSTASRADLEPRALGTLSGPCLAVMLSWRCVGAGCTGAGTAAWGPDSTGGCTSAWGPGRMGMTACMCSCTAGCTGSGGLRTGGERMPRPFVGDRRSRDVGLNRAGGCAGKCNGTCGGGGCAASAAGPVFVNPCCRASPCSRPRIIARHSLRSWPVCMLAFISCGSQYTGQHRAGF